MILRGDSSEDVFHGIYSVHFSSVFNFVYRMIGDRESSKDIVQETFLRAYDKYPQFRGESHVLTWILSIAKNLCYNHARKEKKRSFQSLEKLIDSVGSPANEDRYDEIERRYYIQQVKNGCLLGLLRCLSFYQRCAFILNVLNDQPVKEVARIIKKSENSTRILIHRARVNLRNFLCGNCSLYGRGNRCRCENLIEFSLEKDWIEKYDPPVLPETIESELNAFKDEISLFRTLPDHDAKGTHAEHCSALIKSAGFRIFSDKKVK